MATQLPFPLAYTYRLIDAGKTWAVRYERLLQCYEAVVRYCATVQISNYLADGCPEPDLNRKLLELLGRNLSLGHWVGITHQIAQLQKRGKVAAFMPELVTFFFKPGAGTALTAEGKLFGQLCSVRNDWAHRRETWPDDAFPSKFKEQKEPLLDRLIHGLDFLGRYPLYVPLRGPRPDVVQEALVLMGSDQPPRVATDLNLKLTPRVRDHLEYEMTAFLAAEADPSRQLLLYPLSVFANQNGAEDIFLFDGCDLHKQLVRRLFYRSVSLARKPLEVTPGSDLQLLVEHFKALVEQLGADRPAAAAEPAPEVDLSAHYFAVQREIIRSYTRTFVGREPILRAFDRFLATHRRGYFLVRGGPGQGKTAVACHLAARDGVVHHLINPTGGRDDPRLILGSLLAQLLPRAQRSEMLPDTVPELIKRLEEALAQVVAREKRLTVVIDALDELSPDAELVPPFLVTAGLPEGAYVVVTSRPGDRLDALLGELFAVEHQVHDLGPLDLAEMAAILRARRPAMRDAEVERIAEACQGNPLYLTAVVQELERNPSFDLRELPAGIEGFFRRATGTLHDGSGQLQRDLLGLLTVARKPLSLRELSQATGTRQRQVYEQGIRPVQQFLFETDGAYSFYHARFRDFVSSEVIYEDELPDYHRRLAEWLQRPECRSYDYRWTSLAYHLFAAGDRPALLRAIDAAFLREKVRRFGYAVLEDVELLSRAMLESGDPTLVERCVELVEGLREVVGGDVIEDARQALQPYRPGPTAFRSRVLAPPVPTIPGLDIFVGMLPKIEVGADFFEVIPLRQRLVVALGDAPGKGLKSAFVARFLGNVFHRLIEQAGRPHLGEALAELNRQIADHPYFETISMQCVEIDLAAGIVTLANAGSPYPVLYSARWGQCDRLPIRGDMLQSFQGLDLPPPRYEPRRAEFEPGDVLVLITDGVTEGNRLRGGGYGYRFTQLVEAMAPQGVTARALGEAILDDWRAFPRDADHADDVTVVVISRPGVTAHQGGPTT